MKKFILVAALVLFAAPSFALIADTAHDLSSGSAATIKGTYDRICAYCHTPHGAGVSGSAPLWNRGTVNATGFYNDPAGSMNHATDLAGVNASDAILCLSCHDGASLNSVLTNPPNTTGGVPAGQVGANANLGTNLDNDHPVGFTVTDALLAADTQLHTIAVIEGPASMTGAVSFGSTTDQFWCSSCHDVHGVTGVSSFLRMSNATSALCLNCHNK